MTLRAGLMRLNLVQLTSVLVLSAWMIGPALGQDAAPVPPAAAVPSASPAKEPPEFPEFKDASKGTERVGSPDAPTMYTLYKRDKDARLLAELPRDFDRQRIFIGTTFAGGVPNTGIQVGDVYGYWKRFDKRLALLEVNTDTKSTGDAENKRSEEKLYTDRVIVDVPIVAIGPGGGPVIDATALLVGRADKLFGGQVAGANRELARLAKAKAFPQNVEIAYELPNRDGRLVTIHYSISLIPAGTGYVPREADQRVGYFTTGFRDTSRQDKDTQWVRYINRWHIQKRDPKLQLSPPKQPIVFYIEETVPVQYRRWVRDGVLAWNEAFEKIGIVDAIEVYQQDAASGSHMEKDPEDVRYNFIRWSTSDLGFAIGPSRVHPETGQILDADVVMDDGFLRGWYRSYQQLLPEVAMMGYPAEVVGWLDKNPQWDPRVRLAEPSDRDGIIRQRTLMREQAEKAYAEDVRQRAGMNDALPMLSLRSGAPLQFGAVSLDPTGYALPMRQRMSCAAMLGKSMDMALLRLSAADILELAQDASTDAADEKKDAKKDGKKGEKKKEQLLDGLPESFVGPLLRDVISHEVGHTLGLRHNFKASTALTIQEMNSPEVKGKLPIVASVMDYTPININFNDGKVQGDYAPIGIGAYDMWAVEYGYTLEPNLKPVLARAAEPALAFGTDEDLGGPDPRVAQFDLGKDPLDYADSTMRLTQHLRGKILDKVMKDGDSWAKSRRAYELLLGRHISAVRIASVHIGGADINRFKKGDPNAPAPVTPVDAATQRRALKFVVDNAFNEEAFGLSRELLEKMIVEKWFDAGGMGSIFQSPSYPVHDRILGVQTAVLTMLLNPMTMQRVYDNELRKAPDTDALTVPELLDVVSASIWTELDALGDGTVRKPSISSIRRNLQREYLARLIDLTLPDGSYTAAYRPVQNLTVLKLREIKGKIDRGIGTGGIDVYTKAHLTECSVRIGKALDANYIYASQ